jgi:hypothetical protein
LFRSFTGAPVTVILANTFLYSENPIQNQRCAGRQAYYYVKKIKHNEIPIYLYKTERQTTAFGLELACCDIL